MQPDTFAILGFMAFFGGGLGALFWKRLDRIEVQLSNCVQQEDFERSRGEMKAKIAELGVEMRSQIAELRSEMRSEIAALRSDLTQIALALGTQRPHASEA